MSPGPNSQPAHPSAGVGACESEGADGNPRLAEAVEEYRAALRVGRRLDRQALCARYPDLGRILADCLDALEFVHGAARELDRPGADGAAGPAGIQPGQPLGDYRILREVGRGGMGVVYEAEQVSLRRRVALKVLPFAAVLDPRQLQRFHAEAQAAACLHHQHIVPVYAVGHDRGVHYYAMQLIHGQSLAAIIQGLRRQAPEARLSGSAVPGTDTAPTAPWVDLDRGASGSTPAAAGGDTRKTLATERSRQAPAFFRTIARLGLQAAEALDHAHQQGVIHRDVKPANLLVDTTGNLWVTDFGLAQLPGDAGVTASGDLVGTLRYMSPEQALGKRGFVDHRTDVYSLGVTLYELLTLEPAFGGNDREVLLHRLAHEEPRPLRRLNRAVPVELETVVAKAMAKLPGERYSTAQELAEDLRRFLDDRPVLARRPGPVARLRKWAWRRRLWVAGVAVWLALALVALAWGMAHYALNQRQLAEERSRDALQNQRQRMEAEQSLHHALLGRATGYRLAREPGYRSVAFKDLHDATTLKVPGKDLATIRAEVLAALGDPIGLEPVPPETVKRRPRTPIPETFKALRWGERDEPQAVSQDGKFLAKRGDPRERGTGNISPNWVQVVDSEGNIHGASGSPRGAIYDLQFTPDGRFLVAGCEGGVVSWFLVPGMPLHSFFQAGNVHSVAIHPNNRLLAIAGRALVELWSLPSNRPIATFKAPRLDVSVEFSIDGKYLLAVSRNRILKAWPVEVTPERMPLDGHAEGVPAVAFSPDGRYLASAAKDCVVRIWEVASGKLVRALPKDPAKEASERGGHLAAIEAVAFSPNGQWLATGDIAGVVILWDAWKGAEITRTGGGGIPPGQIWRLQFSPTGTHLAAAGGVGVAVWSIRLDKDKVTLNPFVHTAPPNGPKSVLDLAIHPAGTDFVFLDAKGRLYRCALALGAEPRLLDAPSSVGLRCLSFDDKGEQLTFRTKQGTLGLWSWWQGTARETGQQALHPTLDRSGRRVATTSSGQGVVIYDLREQQSVLTLPPEGSDIWSLAWSPDGRRVAVGLSDGGVAVWDLEQVRAQLAAFGIDTPFALPR
jgi:serine/threonine protein kinase/WD40 repeat protein